MCFISESEYEEILQKKEAWFCYDSYCQEKKIENVGKFEEAKKNNDRSHLSRNCKTKNTELIEQIDDVEHILQMEISNIDHELLVPCLICNDNKLYKRKGGLKIHCTKKHKDEDFSFMFTQSTNKNHVLATNFEEILSYSKNNIRV